MTAPSFPTAEISTKLNDENRYRYPALAAFLISLGIYVLTIASDLSWANGAFDGPELITASVTLGIPHPPGYPTYILLSKLFSLLPMGTVAFRYNLFSAVCAAATTGLVVLIIQSLHPKVRPAAAMSAALLFGFAPLVWSQAIVAEVYSLNLLILAVFLLVWSKRGARAMSGFWLGLAITTHLTSVLFLPALLRSGYRQWRAIGVGLALGLTPLLILPLLALGDSPIVWGRPADPAGWWWLVTGQLFASDFQPLFNIERLTNLLRSIVVGPVAFLMAERTTRESSLTDTEPVDSISQPTLGLLLATSLFYGAFALFYDIPDAGVLLLPMFLILAILIAALLDRVGAVALLLPLILVALTFQERDLSGQAPVRSLAESVLQSAPENALLLSPGDRTIFTLLYFQQVEGIRPDLRLVDENLFAFNWYRARLRERYTDIVLPVEDDLNVLQYDNQFTRSVCWVGLVTPVELRSDVGQDFDESSSLSTHMICIKGAH